MEGFMDQDVLDLLDTIYFVKQPQTSPVLFSYLNKKEETQKIKKEPKMKPLHTVLKQLNNMEHARADQIDFVKHEAESGEDFDECINNDMEDSGNELIEEQMKKRPPKKRYSEIKETSWKVSPQSLENIDNDIKHTVDSSEDDSDWDERKEKNRKSHKKKIVNKNTNGNSVTPTKTPCPYCGVQIGQLTRHVANVHPESFNEYKPAVFKSSNRLREWPKQCEFCEARLASRYHYDKHVRKHQKPLASSGHLYCDKCGEGPFAAESLLRSHIELHQKEVVCTHEGCDRVLINNVKLREHLLMEHRIIWSKEVAVNPKDFLCVHCGKEFASKYYLKMHIQGTHEGVPSKYVCTECGADCKSKPAFENHTALHSEPTVPCPECDKKFHTKSYLLRHIKTSHTPDDRKRYQCSICPKGFNSKDSLTGHLNWHNGLKPFQCTFCDISFADKSNLRAHEKKVHKDRVQSDKSRFIQVKI